MSEARFRVGDMVMAAGWVEPERVELVEWEPSHGCYIYSGDQFWNFREDQLRPAAALRARAKEGGEGE